MPIFQEISSGDAGLSRAVNELLPGRARALSCMDGGHGGSVSSDEDFLRVLEARDGKRREWIHMVPPTATFARSGSPGGTRRRSRKKPEGYGDAETAKANEEVDRCAALGQGQLDRGLHFSIENPADSYVWDLKSIKRLAKAAGVEAISIDRGEGARTVLTNAPWLRGTGHAAEGVKGWARGWGAWMAAQPRRPPAAEGYVKRGRFMNTLVRQELGGSPLP